MIATPLKIASMPETKRTMSRPQWAFLVAVNVPAA